LLLADRYQWTPQQIDVLDVDYVDEMLAKFQAEQLNYERDKRKAERDARNKKR